MIIRLLQRDEIARIWEIDRREYIANIYRLREGALVLERHDFDVPGWSPGKEETETPLFLDCYDRGGSFWGAFDDEIVAGAAILESKLIGPGQDTVQLKWLHTGRDYRGHGVGSTLFDTAAARAKEMGAAKMYISATPSENTVNFYMRRGCFLATEVDPDLFALEPEDIHLEFVI
jgi:GNAT superfamily N-acetyltransferase